MSAASGIPALIYGTAWKKERTTGLVVQAVLAGFRAIDTACQPKHYHEAGVGAALAELAASHGIGRESLYVQSKFTPLDGQDTSQPLPYDAGAPLPQQVEQSFRRSLANLGTGYLDALLLHSPMASHADTMRVWRVFEQLHGQGLVRHIGLSNVYSPSALRRLYADAAVKPSVLQNRFYEKTGYDAAIRAFCRDHHIAYQSFWTLTANPHVLQHAAVEKIAADHRWSPAQVLFKYLVQTGVHPLTGTCSLDHMRDDLAILDPSTSLSTPELAAMAVLVG